MRVEANILVFPEQPSESAWQVLERAAANWDRTHRYQFSQPMRMLLQLRLPDTALPEYRELVAKLEVLRSEVALRVEPSYRRVYDAQDYVAAPFVEIWGVDLDTLPERPFVLNREQALVAPVSCPSCHWNDAFNACQIAPFEIDESLLDQPLQGTEQKPAGGWDCVNLPNGHKLVSQRLISLLEEGDVRGYELLPVLVGKTGKKSTRMFQILARRTILVPCNQSEGVSYCETCGAVLDLPRDRPSNQLFSTPDPEFRIDEGQLQGDEILSRHSGRGAMLYISQRVYRMLLERPVIGIVPGEIIRVCEQT